VSTGTIEYPLISDGDGGNAPVDLPYCGIGNWAEPGVPETPSKRSLWGGVLGGIKKTKVGGKTVFASCVPKSITIPVYWRVITGNCSTASLVTPAVLSNTVAELNAAYNKHNIFFTEPRNNVKYFQPDGNDVEGYRRFTQNEYGTETTDAFNHEFMMRPTMRQPDARNRVASTNLHLFVVEKIQDVSEHGEGRTNGSFSFWSPELLVVV
jgi:hypothetical protein